MVLTEPRRLVPRDFERPPVSADDAWLRIEACGLCGTDHEQYTGELHGGFAFVPGHESIGVIDEIGEIAATRWGVSAGDRVAVEVFLSCGRCAQCRSGTYRRCEQHGLGDMYGFIGVDKPPALWGGYAEYQYLAPDSLVLAIPPSLDPVIATLFNPVGAGIRWGATLPGTGVGDVVAVLGPGIRGLATVAAAKDAGAGFVMATGSGARDHARLESARSFGADLTIDVSEQDPAAALAQAVGAGADIVVDVTAKAPAALAQAMSIARAGATIVLAGTRGSNDTPGFVPDNIVYRELRILGALGVDTGAYRAAIDLLAAHRYPFADLDRRVVGFAELDRLLAAMAGETDAAPPVHAVFAPGPIEA